MHLKMSSAIVVCCKILLTYLTKLKIETKSVNPDQSDLGLHCLLERLLKHFSRREKQATIVVIGVLRVNI